MRFSIRYMSYTVELSIQIGDSNIKIWNNYVYIYIIKYKYFRGIFELGDVTNLINR